jgi:hypothetical protein
MGYAAQIIWNAATRAVDQTFKIEYIPIYKLGVNYDGENKVDGYWSLIGKSCEIQVTLYPKFTGKTTVKFGNSLYVRPTAGLFSLSDYLSGLYWASVEGN